LSLVELGPVIGVRAARLSPVALAPFVLVLEQVAPADLPVAELLEADIDAVESLDHRGDLADAALEVVDPVREVEEGGVPDALADLW